MRTQHMKCLKIGLASPRIIKLWASFVLPDRTRILREVTEPKYINELGYPILGGLFCQRIFGPSLTYQCLCLSQTRRVYRLPPIELAKCYEPFPRRMICPIHVVICMLCKVEISPTWVRRYRMGVINLVEPVANVLYVTYIRSILNLSNYQLKRILFFKDYISYGVKPLHPKSKRYKHPKYKRYFNLKSYGGLHLKHLLDEAQRTLVKEYRQVREKLLLLPKKSQRLFWGWRLKQLHLFLTNPTKMSWMILQVLPVLPPRLRPFLQFNNRWFFSDVNDAYKIVVIRNNRLRQFKRNHLMDKKSRVPDKSKALYAVQVANLQRGVDKLIYTPPERVESRDRSSLTTFLHGKRGLFRRHLLGKRVDFSARSVIVPAPHMPFGYCGLPLDIVHELFRPFLRGKLSPLKPKFDMAHLTLRRVHDEYSRNRAFRAWLQNFCTSSYVYLNRAPTLHKMNIQAFIPRVVRGKAVHFTPLACRGFNADFDGDQMGIFLPITKQARQEVKNRLYTCNNSFDSAKGKLVLVPSQDMIVGINMLRTDGVTSVLHNHHYFASMDDIWTSFDAGLLGTDSIVWVRHGRFPGPPRTCSSFLVTTVGRLILSRTCTNLS